MEEITDTAGKTLTPEQLYKLASLSDKEHWLCLLDGYPAYTNGTMDTVIRTRWTTVYSALAKDIHVEDSVVLFKYDGDSHELRVQRITDVDPMELIAEGLDNAAGK